MLAVVCCWCSMSAPAAQNGSSPDRVTSITEMSEPMTRAFPPEVRLRKLHLVRPDLIPYPIAYEVYC